MDTSEPRSDVDHCAIRLEAVTIVQVHGKPAAREVLKRADMVSTHLHCDCPFVGGVEHLTPACFPGDRLHLQYVHAQCLVGVDGMV